MKDPDVKHPLESDKDKPRSFSETAIELLEWRKSEFSGKVFEASDAEGKEEIKRSFVSKEGFEDNPEKLVRVLDFLASKMKIDDGGQLRRKLNELRNGGSVSILPTDKKLPPSEILRNLLGGGYDEKINVSEIAGRGQAYTLALYLYMHTSGDSEEEMTETLAQLIRNYDDPKVSLYEYGIDGLKAEPFLADLCTKTIEKHGLTQSMRERFKGVLSKAESPDDWISHRNARLVIPSSDSIPPSS